MDKALLGRISLDLELFAKLTKDEREAYYSYIVEQLRAIGSVENNPDHRSRATTTRIAKFLRFTATQIKNPAARGFINNRMAALVQRGILKKALFNTPGRLRKGQHRERVAFIVATPKKVRQLDRFPNNGKKTMRVVNAIRNRVEDGTYTARLPTIYELADELNVSSGTVGVGYDKLKKEGVIKTVVGHGTFINSTTINKTAMSWHKPKLQDRVRDAAHGALPSYNEHWSDIVKAAWFNAYAATQK